jgi:predicted amidohydrolase
MSNSFKVALCQMGVVDDKEKNIKKAVDMIDESAKNGVKLVVLPEMFNCPYDNSKFPGYAETAGTGSTIASVSKAARENSVYVVAGSIPEKENNKIFNTCFIFDDNGRIIGRHRKIHLFDIDIPDKIVFKESDVLTPGNDITVVDTAFCRIGVAICYDVRFPEIFRKMVLMGAELIIVPAAFNMTTGPAHWEVLIRTRAIDNQVFMAAVSPARNERASYIAYGNSMAVDPWGEILTRAQGKEEILFSDIDLSRVARVRRELPVLRHRRSDIY